MALDTATIVAPGTTPGSHPAEPSLGTLFRRILAAEWTKLRSVRSTTITLAVTVLVCVGLGALFCYGMVSRWDQRTPQELSLIHISEPTRLGMTSYAVVCWKKKTTR